MARDRNGSAREEEIGAEGDGEERGEEPSGRERRQKAKGRKEESSGDSSGDSDSERARGKKRKRKGRRSRGSRRRDADSKSEEESSYSDSDSESGTDSEGDSESDSESEAESEEMLRRRKRKERRRKEREQEKERRRRKEKERERRRKREKEERRRRKERKKEKEKEKKKKKEKDTGTKGAVTNSWGKYGVIKETDMWNKRPEFSAWLAEVKQVNLETLSNWEEKQLFKQFMEDHNTATFPSKKYYSLDAYYRRKIENELKKGNKKVVETERINFNDEEQRRQELMLEREKQKAEKVEELKRSMQSGMAQAMKEQGRLREEMAYQYKLGNFEAAAAIQRRLDPDVPM